MNKGLKEVKYGEILREALLILIDDALDRNDREKFLMLTKELQGLSEKIG